ncbi:anthranilate synthase component I [Bacillus canaveralius]|uniref:Anthranilate synthase component 1 n=1 Tax=Bacillus canaveralius TaxID=1403243 RepID=A0A2N5GIS5_9BACI|nr:MULTISPECIES: anthranilate synthase component I [Bacillus]PLR80885.1 anthranilate synthase component I [Bacillus canaveralius]PLR83389.1 anthranilate synthase component I [Bacillus sp. V33-4]PLR91173.1 anthranilate synthase component I [Bacillus canaveralius]RSK51749.1 anthranilate synthase component I [Bacillus canaveralius]
MKSLLENKNLIVEQLEGDTFTPILIFQRLSGRKKFLLESSLKYEASGRYSFIGTDPVFELTGNGDRTTIKTETGQELRHEKPLEVLKSLLPENGAADFPLAGGAVGYAGYDVIRQYENIGENLPDELSIPEVHFMFYEDVIVFDHLEQKISIVASPLRKETTIDELKDRIAKRKTELLAGGETKLTNDANLSAFKASISKNDFIEKVAKAKKYISEGDIFQVVLSQRLQATFTGDPFSFYRKLRVGNPSPYMYYLDFGDYVVAGSSPESLIKANGKKVTTNPIAGTRPRGKTEQEDRMHENSLLVDEKELAEHRMLVDLGRNDLGRICEFGTVHVDKYMALEKFKHVMHLVSEVTGTLNENYKPIDALISCLPAGTVSGAPKIRAMEIINELEEVKRGVYSGAVGYVSASGNLDFALAIRTMLIKNDKAYIQAGAGIVYDSSPEKEYEETLHKLKAFLEDQDDIAN